MGTFRLSSSQNILGNTCLANELERLLIVGLIYYYPPPKVEGAQNAALIRPSICPIR